MSVFKNLEVALSGWYGSHSSTTKSAIIFSSVLVFCILVLAGTLLYTNPGALLSSAFSTVSVSVYVKDGSGLPISGATIQVSGGGVKGVTTGLTDSQGFVVLKPQKNTTSRSNSVTVVAKYQSVETSRTAQCAASCTVYPAFSQSFSSAGSTDIVATWRQRTVNAKTIEQYIGVVETMPELEAVISGDEQSGESLSVYVRSTGQILLSLVRVPTFEDEFLRGSR